MAIAGPSGSGKTTLLNLIGALDAATSGTIRVDGRDIGGLSQRELSDLRRDRIGFVFQAYNLVPVLTAAENAEYVMELKGVPARERRQRIAALFERMGIRDLMDTRPLKMSGGQQQRVAVARAIASEPALVLADEPTANLDQATGRSLVRPDAGAEPGARHHLRLLDARPDGAGAGRPRGAPRGRRGAVRRAQARAGSLSMRASRLCAAVLCAGLLAPAPPRRRRAKSGRARTARRRSTSGRSTRRSAGHAQPARPGGRHRRAAGGSSTRPASSAAERGLPGDRPASGRPARASRTPHECGAGACGRTGSSCRPGGRSTRSIASDHSLIGGAAFGSSVPVAGSQAAGKPPARRLRPRARRIATRSCSSTTSTCWPSRSSSRGARLVVGRQVLSWGTGRFWNPTDLLSPFAPTDVDREVRHGVDAIRYSLPLGKTVARRPPVPAAEAGLGAGRRRARAGEREGFRRLGVRGEVRVGRRLRRRHRRRHRAARRPRRRWPTRSASPISADPGDVEIEERFVRGVVGVDWRPAEGWTLGRRVLLQRLRRRPGRWLCGRATQRPRHARRGLRGGAALRRG